VQQVVVDHDVEVGLADVVYMPKIAVAAFVSV
jgi:hypothetical protein